MKKEAKKRSSKGKSPTKESGRKNRRYSVDFKVEAVARILGGEQLASVARDLKIWPSVLYDWLARYRRQGTKLLRGPGRPSGDGLELSEAEVAARRIAVLERKVGQQETDLDFLKRAFERVKELRQRSTNSGGSASTSPSEK
jgi:transposase-like protein